MISGSTRLKAGTSQKIVLNTISSAIMVRLNKVYGNLMVDLKPTNAKLFARTVRLAGALAILRAAVFFADRGFAVTRADLFSALSSGAAMPASWSSPSDSEVSRGS